MKKSELQRDVEDARSRWEAVIAELGPEGLERPGACDDWRVRDVIAHINGWDRWQILQLRNAFTGEESTMDELVGGLEYPEEDHFLSTDERNAVFTKINTDRPLDDVLADFREISQLQTDWVDSASQEDVDTMVGVKFGDRMQAVFRMSEVPDAGNPRTAANWIMEQMAHRNEHLDAVRAWMTGSRRPGR